MKSLEKYSIKPDNSLSAILSCRKFTHFPIEFGKGPIKRNSIIYNLVKYQKNYNNCNNTTKLIVIKK